MSKKLYDLKTLIEGNKWDIFTLKSFHNKCETYLLE